MAENRLKTASDKEYPGYGYPCWFHRVPQWFATIGDLEEHYVRRHSG